MHCHSSPLWRGVTLVAKLVLALFAVHYLLVYLGYNLIGGMAMPGTTADAILHWVVGLAGVYLLVKIVLCLINKDGYDSTHPRM